MSKIRHLLVLPAAALFLAACSSDEPEKVTPVEPAAPALSVSSADNAPSLAAALANKQSSICRNYQRKVDKVKAALDKAPKDEKLKAQSKALAAIAKDACD